ncbi:hypothetical protein LBMAG47_29090 [Planctomycetia bacterium]|nr:hypothetical protein LBMAG47_29090 [Planctomycetia bacterium]
MGLCTRHLDLHHSVLRALDPWDTGMDQRVELAGVEMLPLPLGGVVVAGQLTATMRADPAAAFGVLNVDMDLGRLDIEPHVRHLPRSGQAKNLLMEFRVEHAICLRGKAAFSTTELPTKIPD